MDIQAEQMGSGVLLRPRGALMGGGVNEALHRRVREYLAEGIIRVAVSLESVPWINSSGIGTILGCTTECEEAGGALALVGANDRIRGLLASLDLIDRLQLLEPSEAADWLEVGA